MSVRLLLLTLLLLPLSASSQVTWGFKAGLNLNTIRVPNDDYSLEDYGIQAAYHAGGFGLFEFSGRSALGTELLFSQRGFRYDETRHALNYLVLPVYYQHALFPDLAFQAGLSAELLLGYRVDGYKNQDLVSDGSFSLLAGVTYIANINWRFSARYYHALSPYLDTETIYAGTANDRIRYFTRTVEISVGFVVL